MNVRRLVAGIATTTFIGAGLTIGAGLANACGPGEMVVPNGCAPAPPAIVSTGPGGPSQYGGPVPGTLIVWNSVDREHQKAVNQGDWLSTQEALESDKIEPID